MLTVGNRSIWFGTIFPYMVMLGNEGISFSTIIYKIDVTFLLVLQINPITICFESSFKLHIKHMYCQKLVYLQLKFIIIGQELGTIIH